MSLRIIKNGILDTIQDQGRYGFQHIGINPGGAMDRFSSQLSNALLGKDLTAAVIELHFPASQILFEKETIICICGADFLPTINDQPIPLHQPVAVNKKCVLKFNRLQSGARCYLSVANELKLDKWMNSYSTNLKAGAGGLEGRILLKNDVLLFQNGYTIPGRLLEKDFATLPWKAQYAVDAGNEMEFVIGSEWHWLTKEAQENFTQQWFQISNDADRMGYRLAAQKLQTNHEEQLVSSAANFGTVQLLPNGQLIILMADHQTTGGYPRVAHIISAHLSLLAQKTSNDVIKFKLTSLEKAAAKALAQKKYLNELQIACKFRMGEVLSK